MEREQHTWKLSENLASLRKGKWFSMFRTVEWLERRLDGLVGVCSEKALKVKKSVDRCRKEAMVRFVSWTVTQSDWHY